MKHGIFTITLLAVLLSGTFTAAAVERLKVATLHPLLADLAVQAGGERVEVKSLLKPGAEAHRFEPAAAEVASLKQTKLLLACGKGLENYLGKLRDTLPAGVLLVEVGKTIPSIKMEDVCLHDHDHDHDHGKDGVDPHWWHSADAVSRALDVIGEALAKADPAGEDVYEANVEAAQKKVAAVKSWAKEQISTIPAADRKLVTAHAAFGYFCKEYGFKALPVLGSAGEADESPQHVADIIRTIREMKIRAVFPEDQSNPKVLKEIVRETGVKVGGDLIADGTSPGAGSTFEGMMRYNVTEIVKALGVTPAKK